MTSLKISTSTSAIDAPTITASGELDVASGDDLVTAVESVLEGAATLTLNLAGVTFMDSTGLSALVTIRNRVDDRGGNLVLQEVSPAVYRVLVLVGMDGLFGVEQQGVE